MHQWAYFDTIWFSFILFIAAVPAVVSFFLFGRDNARRMKAAGCRRPRFDRRRFR
jgi:hypothetical protein